MTWFYSKKHGMVNLDKYNVIGIEYDLVGYMRKPIVTARKVSAGKTTGRAVLCTICPDASWAEYCISWISEKIVAGADVINESWIEAIIEENSPEAESND